MLLVDEHYVLVFSCETIKLELGQIGDCDTQILYKRQKSLGKGFHSTRKFLSAVRSD